MREDPHIESSAARDVAELTRRFLEALHAGDSAGVASFFEDDAVYLPANHPAIEGSEAIARFQRQVVEDLQPEFSLEPKQTIEAGDLVVQRGGYTVRVRSDLGENVESTGKYLIVYRRQEDGSLRVLWDMDNSDALLDEEG